LGPVPARRRQWHAHPGRRRAGLLSPTCLVHITLDGVVTAGCATYDAASNTFQYDLKTTKSLAPDTHIVGIRVDAPDGSGVVNTDSTTVVIKK
jgi:hypothetical protein